MIEHLRLKDKDGDIIGFNEDIISEILAKGQPEDLKAVSTFWQENGRQITDEEMKIYSYYQRLRQQVHAGRQLGLKKRKAEAPEKTKEELSLGCYLEELEPQVRQVILNLNNKGYKTQGSGFGPENTQSIYCRDDQFQNLELDNQLILNLKSRGIEIKIKPKNLTLFINKKLNLDELKEIWLEIEEQIDSKFDSK